MTNNTNFMKFWKIQISKQNMEGNSTVLLFGFIGTVLTVSATTEMKITQIPNTL